ncbi:hypothetical protein AB6M97_06235 [Streptococcus hillyeri]|uniref:beta-sandwich lipoprotein n=1 Tax=Streptococcus hillyeri TaxID=2282420 RepID=UPI0034E2C4E3
MKKKLIAGLMVLASVVTLAACREKDRVSYNVSKEADSFNVRRKVTIINIRTDKIEFTAEGLLSVDYDEDTIDIIMQVGEDSYRKHIVEIADENMFIVEDLGKTKVDKYKYEIEYMPESAVPFTVTNNE